MPDYGIPLFTKIGVRTTDSGVLDVPYDSFYGLTARDYLEGTTDAFTFDFQHRVSDALTIRNVSRYSENLNDYVVTNPGDGGNVLGPAGRGPGQRRLLDEAGPEVALEPDPHHRQRHRHLRQDLRPAA